MFRVPKVRYSWFTDKPNRFIQTLTARCSPLSFNLFLLISWRHMGVHKMKIWGSQIYNHNIIFLILSRSCWLHFENEIVWNPEGKSARPTTHFDLNLIDWSNMFVHQTSADVRDLFGFLNSAVKRNFKSLEVFGERKHVLICIYVVTLSCLTESFQVSLLPKPTFVSEARSFAGKYVRELPTIPLCGLKVSCSQWIQLIRWIILCIFAVLGLRICRYHVSKQESSPPCGLDLIALRTRSRFDSWSAPWLLRSSSSVCVTNDGLCSCRDSTAGRLLALIDDQTLARINLELELFSRLVQ